MNTFVLIVVILGTPHYGGQAVTTTSVDFNSYSSCKKAKTKVIKMVDDRTKVSAICVEK